MPCEYPQYRTHTDARCFNCGGALDGKLKDTDAPSAGRWAQRCADCDMSTWYDIDERETEDAPEDWERIAGDRR